MMNFGPLEPLFVVLGVAFIAYGLRSETPKASAA